MLTVKFDREWLAEYLSTCLNVEQEKISDSFINKLVKNPVFRDQFKEDIRNQVLVDAADNGGEWEWDLFLSPKMKLEIGWEEIEEED